MILSYHPCILGHENRLMAGREPDDTDRLAMKRASAILLPQGCRREFFEMARACCTHVFPDYTARFTYPDKSSQLALFERTGVPFPKTWTFSNADDWFRRFSSSSSSLPFTYPVMVKVDGLNQGEGVFLVQDRQQLCERITQITGTKGPSAAFMVQSYIPARGRALRIVVMGNQRHFYWRVNDDNTGIVSASTGARIDHDVAKSYQDLAMSWVNRLCKEARIDLAGIDCIFDSRHGDQVLYFLEINHFFGRKGLGGSLAFYEKLTATVREWLAVRDLCLPDDVPIPSWYQEESE